MYFRYIRPVGLLPITVTVLLRLFYEIKYFELKFNWILEEFRVGKDCCGYRVPSQDGGTLHVLQAVLADVELGQAGVLLGVGWGVPCIHHILTHLKLLDAVLLFLGQLVVSTHLVLLQAEINAHIIGGFMTEAGHQDPVFWFGFPLWAKHKLSWAHM